MAGNGPQVAEGGYTRTLKWSTDMEDATNIPNEEQTGRLQQPAVRRCPLCSASEVEGKRLEFIAWIHRDGSGVTPMVGKDTSIIERDVYGLQCLSITQGTWIASAFNSYVVRLKDSA